MTARYLIKKYGLLSLLVLLFLCPQRATGQTVIRLVDNRSDTVQLTRGVTYRVHYEGSDVVGYQEGQVILQAPEGMGIRVSGDLQLASGQNVYVGPEIYYDNQSIDCFCQYSTLLIRHAMFNGSSSPFFLTVTTECCENRHIHDVVCQTTLNACHMTWQDSSLSTQWRVRYGLHPDSLTLQVQNNSPEANLLMLSPGTMYYYRIENEYYNNPDTLSCSIVMRFKTKCADWQTSEVVHDVSVGPVVISAGDFCTRHVITGRTRNANNHVTIESGFFGTVVLRDLDMSFRNEWVMTDTGWVRQFSQQAPIWVRGESGGSNERPVTIVDFVLEGNNRIHFSGNSFACIQLDFGTVGRFSAVNPAINSSGTLCVTQENSNGGAAIGSPIDYRGMGVGVLQNGQSCRVNGGNIVVTSGIIYAKGGHGAGLGGGYGHFYDGMVLVTGGVVNTQAIFDAAGIGSGCPRGTGIIQDYSMNSAIIALPPAMVTAYGAGANANGGVGFDLFPSLGLAGTRTILYIGDTNQHPITIRTADNLPGATIYADLSKCPEAMRVWRSVADTNRFNIRAVKFGVTDASGAFTTYGNLRDSITFFTDAYSTTSPYEGCPYAPVTTTLTAAQTVTLPHMAVGLALDAQGPGLLLEGYTNNQALGDAYTVYATRQGASGLSFSLVGGQHFRQPIVEVDEHNVVHTVSIPLQHGLPAGKYTDILLVRGTSVGGYPFTIRHVLTQFVVATEEVHICEPRTSYTLGNGTVVTSPGTYLDTLSALSGQNYTDESYMSCDGTQYDYSSSSMVASDSIVRVVISFHSTPMDTVSLAQCDSLDWRGSRYFESGTYQKRTPSDGYCDSLHTLHLTIHPSVRNVEERPVSCYWDVWRGDTIRCAHDTLLQLRFTSLQGCDSVEATLLKVRDSSVTVLDSLRWCYSYFWHGRPYREMGFQDAVYRTRNQWGCDSIVHLPLTILDTIRTHTVLEGCDSVTFLGTTYTSSRHSATHHLSVDGCDSVSTVDLTVHPSFHGETTRYVCLGDEELGDFTLELTTRHGCDSIVVEHVLAGEMPVAALYYSPTLADPDHLEIELRDGCPNAARREWFFNSEPYGDGSAELIYHYPYGEDSVSILLVDYSSAGCTDSAWAVIPFAGGVLWVPNAFTPDMGNNREFRVFSQGIATMEVSVFTRAGLHVATFDGLTGSWDGTRDGQPLPQASYTYLITYTTQSKPNNPLHKMGTITLIR